MRLDVIRLFIFRGLPRDEEQSDEFYVAAGLGFEPRYMDPESMVLPLDDPAKN